MRRGKKYNQTDTEKQQIPFTTALVHACSIGTALNSLMIWRGVQYDTTSIYFYICFSPLLAWLERCNIGVSFLAATALPSAISLQKIFAS